MIKTVVWILQKFSSFCRHCHHPLKVHFQQHRGKYWQIGLWIGITQWMLLFPAIALTVDFQWRGETGYQVVGSFDYDETLASSLITEKGSGKSQVIDNFTVSFYNPAGDRLATYHNIVNGQIQGNYFQFQFNPATKQAVGSLDIGGESSGEMYLQGEIDDQLTVIEVIDNRDRLLDQQHHVSLEMVSVSPR